MRASIEQLDKNFKVLAADKETDWYDIRELGVEGRGWHETETFYDRLPAKAKALVRPDVWTLSRHSAGMAARFLTDAPKISARWTLRNNMLSMHHMPSTGVAGLDLYLEEQERWRWIGVGIPTQFPDNETAVANVPGGTLRHFLLYLPLYNGVEAVAIGLKSGSKLAAAPAWPQQRKPICFYGTSITQGGCAARPGMAYPALIGRHLRYPTINLGFSGNGPMDLEMAPLLGELDVAAYVLDGLPNMAPEMVAERAAPFVRTLRQARPTVPIVLVENVTGQNTLLGNGPFRSKKNDLLQAAFRQLTAEGVPALYYQPGGDLLGQDMESTVDGCHPTDLGFHRLALGLEPLLKAILV